MARMRIEIDPRTEGMTEAVLECREMMHPWRRQGRPGVYGKTRSGVVQAVEVVRECTRCGTQRIDVYSARDWSLVHRTYRYADGYRPKRDANDPRPPLTRNQVRAALFAADLLALTS